MPPIRIRRGTTAPVSLLYGELGWDAAASRLYIGNSAGVPELVNRQRIAAIHGDLDTVMDQSISLATYIDGPANYISLAARTQSGTCLVRLRRNTTSLGTSTTSVGPSARAVIDYWDGSLIKGDELWLDITSTTNVVGFRFSVWFDSPDQSLSL